MFKKASELQIGDVVVTYKDKVRACTQIKEIFPIYNNCLDNVTRTMYLIHGVQAGADCQFALHGDDHPNNAGAMIEVIDP
jgi:hypothetical protein